jgi:hypothetical protein
LIDDVVRADIDAVLKEYIDPGNCTPLIDENSPACASTTSDEIVDTTCNVLSTVSVVVLMSSHTRFVIRPEPALITLVLVSDALIEELPFMLSVDIAGS